MSGFWDEPPSILERAVPIAFVIFVTFGGEWLGAEIRPVDRMVVRLSTSASCFACGALVSRWLMNRALRREEEFNAWGRADAFQEK